MSLPTFVYDLDAVLAGKRPELPATVGELSGPEGRHAVTVKRLGVGEQLLLIDGHGAGIEATVTSVSKAALQFDVDKHVEFPDRPPVTIVQALPKSERSELAVDLMTQGGADVIVPWQAARSIAKWGAKAEKAGAKWRSMAVAASKQSRRMRIPEIAPLASTADVIAQVQQLVAAGGVAVVLHEDAAVPFSTVEFGARAALFVVGPEGGLSPEEVSQLTAAGAVSALLGPEVLRTASAGLVALAAHGALARW
ncbi:16S rRNA (uracil(1498)-N(3))-methyltransferase [Corynebacterium sp. H128]|uniref:16S rRNA (uracil(1498)-N(3))-methyltransferase n=1 Tax=unclassified Corynebacterium TaxID=2624378 RepID=UPI0030A5DC5E